jgi:hypothetical protein
LIGINKFYDVNCLLRIYFENIYFRAVPAGDCIAAEVTVVGLKDIGALPIS